MSGDRNGSGTEVNGASPSADGAAAVSPTPWNLIGSGGVATCMAGFVWRRHGLPGALLLLAGCADAGAPSGDGDVRFPLAAWMVTQEFGTWNPAWEGYHLADDLDAAPGDPVVAPVGGVVRARYFGSAISGYGGLMLVEHTVGGETFVSLYGHVSTRRGSPVSVGETIAAGQIIAYVADDDEDGGAWGPHLHFGIRRGAFDAGATVCGAWLYVGYTRACAEATHEAQRASWHNPTEFLLTLGAVAPEGPGGPGPRP